MKAPVLLCYHLTGERAAQIRLLAMRYQIRFRPVSPAEYGEPIAALCGLEDKTGAPAPDADFPDEMLLLAFFPPALANAFLSAFRKSGVAPVALKAMLTETNSRWDSIALHAELSREADALRGGQPPTHSQA